MNGMMHFMKINSIFKKISLWILRNIHTLFCLIGIVLVSTGAFLINAPAGFATAGSLLIVLAVYIDRTNSNR